MRQWLSGEEWERRVGASVCVESRDGVCEARSLDVSGEWTECETWWRVRAATFPSPRPRVPDYRTSFE